MLNWLVGSVGAKGGVTLNPSGPWDDVASTASAANLDDFERLVEQIRTGDTRMLMLHNVDPVYALPATLKLRDAILSAQDLFVVSFSPFIDGHHCLGRSPASGPGVSGGLGERHS